MCNLYSITTNQAAIIALFRVVNRYVDRYGNFDLVKPQAGPFINPSKLPVEHPRKEDWQGHFGLIR
jgi:hypothetical protein